MYHRSKTESRNYSYLFIEIITQVFKTAFIFFLIILSRYHVVLHAQQVDSTLVHQSGSASIQPNGLHRPPIIGAMMVLGNIVTEKNVILREMTLAVGDTVSDEEIEYCRTRIYSLGLFNRVDIEYPPIDTTVLIITVNERWFIYPVPLLGVVDRDLSKWFYGLGIVHHNFQGRNEKLFGGFVLGYNPWARFEYSSPAVFDQRDIFSTTTVSYSHLENKSLLSRGTGSNFYETQYSISQTVGKRVDPYNRFWFSSGFSYVEVSEKLIGRTSSPNGIDRYLFFGIGISHDTRNLREYPTHGMFGSLSISKYGFGESYVDYVSTSLDIRRYNLIPFNISFGVRGFTRIVFGPDVPNYHHTFFGFSERIRGHFKEEMEGENIFGASAELRIPIVSSWYVYVPEVPVPQFATWRFGLYAALFADAGNVWNKHETFRWNSIPSGYGGGLHFLFPYGYVFRIEYAWNEFGRGELVLDVGASF